jgi:hypothetical protein
MDLECTECGGDLLTARTKPVKITGGKTVGVCTQCLLKNKDERLTELEADKKEMRTAINTLIHYASVAGTLTDNGIELEACRQGVQGKNVKENRWNLNMKLVVPIVKKYPYNPEEIGHGPSGTDKEGS